MTTTANARKPGKPDPKGALDYIASVRARQALVSGKPPVQVIGFVIDFTRRIVQPIYARPGEGR